MFSRLLYIFPALLLYTIAVNAQWVSLNPAYAPGSKPKVQLLSSSETESVIKVELPGYYLKELNANGKRYVTLDIGDEAITTETGFPELPHIAKVLAIPDRGTVNVEVIDKSEEIIQHDVSVAPARESWFEGQPETEYIENKSAYSSENLYPAQYVRSEDPAVFRDFRIARISVYPLRYSPGKREIHALSSITVRITYGSGIGLNPKTSPQRSIAPSFAKLYRSFIFNYAQVLHDRYADTEDGFDVMLCIMPDMFYDTFQAYAQWKTMSGTKIIMKKFSEIGATSNNPLAVKNCVTSYYLGTPGSDIPTHVLLIGDYGVAPIYTVSYGYTFPNEDYFVEIEGNDYFPELFMGRFTNADDYRLQILVNKGISYEKNPDLAPGDWYKRSTVCSNDAYASQIETKRFAAKEMQNYGFLSVDTMMSKTPCLYTLTDVINAINAGRSYLNYRGEGWSTGWWADCYPFNTTNVNSLNNGRKLTFVTSIGCGVAMFNASGTDNCFGEAWIELGTPTEPRGGCAFLGPTSNTHTTYNNKIDIGIYIGMFEEGMDSPGEALTRGKLYMYTVFGNIYYVEYHYRVYCVLGDPALHVWKNIPVRRTITHPNEIYIGYNQVNVTVKDSLFGVPIKHARVTITGNNIFAYGETNENGAATLDITAAETGQLTIVVTGEKVSPYQSVINVVLGTENVTPNGSPEITDTDGNLDGKVNPNEHCTMKFWLKNWGTIPSQNVYATLSVPDTVPFVQVINDSISFGTIAPNDSVSSSPFTFYVAPECSVGFPIPFTLHVASSTASWNYNYNVDVQGCILDLTETLVDDAGNILWNFRMDPGETVKLRMKVSNPGSDIAPDVLATLSSTDEYITILDSVGTFGNILIDSTIINQDDYFVVKVADNCPVKYLASFYLRLSTRNGYYPYNKNIDLILPVAMPSPPDPTGPDLYGYYAYSNADTLWKQAPVYNWFEIEAIGTQVPKPSGINDFTVTVNLPFTFKYYGNDQTQVRVSSDGWIAFGSGTQTAFLNRPIPCNDTINNMVAPFWDDLFVNTGPTGKLLYYYDQAQHRFIIEWFQVPHLANPDDIETFQVILNDPAYYPVQTGDGEIIFQYQTVVEPSSCTVGIEDDSETIGLEYLVDELYDATANELTDNLAIKFTTAQPVIVSAEDHQPGVKVPENYALGQNFPNPFNPVTRIIYSIPKASQVTLKIYRVEGELVRTIRNAFQNPGTYEVTWDGRNDQGVSVSSGVYFYTLNTGDFVKTKKMILLK